MVGISIGSMEAVEEDVTSMPSGSDHRLHRHSIRSEVPSEGTPLYKVVLTGGPCGGKTTAMARLTDFFRKYGKFNNNKRSSPRFLMR